MTTALLGSSSFIHQSITTSFQYESAEIQTHLHWVTRELLGIEHCFYIRDLELYVAHLKSRESYNYTVVEKQLNVEVIVPHPTTDYSRSILYRNSQRAELLPYLISDLLSLIIDYSGCYVQHFSIGMPVAVCSHEMWYAGTIKHILLLNDFAFLYVPSETYNSLAADWISAVSSNIKCFHTSAGKLIETGEYIAGAKYHRRRDARLV